MSKVKSVGEYFKEVNNGGLPTGDGLNKPIPTPPHSGTQRPSSANTVSYTHLTLPTRLLV